MEVLKGWLMFIAMTLFVHLICELLWAICTFGQGNFDWSMCHSKFFPMAVNTDEAKFPFVTT